MYPILFQIGPITFKTLGVFIVLGFFAAAYTMINRSIKQKLNLDFISDHLVSFILTPLVSARLFYVIENWYKYSNDLWGMLKIHDGNFSFWGGMFGFIGILFYWSFQKKALFWKWFDLSFLAGMLGLSIAYIGLFFSGDIYGKPTDLPWGVVFDNPDVRFTDPIHPTQLYFALTYFIIFITFSLYSKKKRKDGIVSLNGLILFAIANIMLDFLLGDRIALFAEITFSQIISFLVLMIAIVFLILKPHKIQTNNL